MCAVAVRSNKNARAVAFAIHFAQFDPAVTTSTSELDSDLGPKESAYKVKMMYYV